MLSLVIPVYRNEESLDRLLAALVDLNRHSTEKLEVVFVIDGSPDHCLDILRGRLAAIPLDSRLIALSRNFGSFAAISAGLEAGVGDYFAVLAADLQEPPGLVLQFVTALKGMRPTLSSAAVPAGPTPGSPSCSRAYSGVSIGHSW
jgi:glycosyltransferase involved in cell wall biosynthesis